MYKNDLLLILPELLQFFWIHFNENLLSTIASCNNISIQIGVESGYNEGLKKIHKGILRDDILRGAKILNRYGLQKSSLFSFIIGFPWETYDGCQKTIETAAFVKGKYGVSVNCVWWIPLPSEEYDNIYEKSGLERFGYWDNAWEADKTIIFPKMHDYLSYKQYEKINRLIKLYQQFGVSIVG